MKKEMFDRLIRSSRQALDHAERETANKKERAASIAKYAAENAGSEVDLDEFFEPAGKKLMLASNHYQEHRIGEVPA